MSLAHRLVRALWIFGIIFFGYVSLFLVTSIFGTWEKDAATGREVEIVPGWVRGYRRWLDRTNSKRLLRGMLSLRGVYIKLGQILSIMGGFLPRVYTKELEQLQDAVPPRPFAEIERAFFESLGQRPDEAFARFDEVPLAAASLGQVHAAWLRGENGGEGRKVAVKVLYPGIRDVIRVDMQVIRLAVHAYKWFVPVTGIERVHEALVDLLRRETEYLHEADCMRRMARNFAREKDILFPEPIAELTSSDVLTMTFMDGIKINRVDEMRAANIDPHAVATRFVESFYKQLFLDRLFHADPHPGNFLVQPGRNPRRPKIVVLDFGAVSEVKDDLVEGLLDIIGGLLEHDGKKLLDGFLRMGFASKEANRELLERTVETYFQRLLRIKDRTPAALMRANRNELEALVDPEVAREELRELMRSVEYPDGWFYVERASVLAFWLVGTIDPEIDAMRVGYPYVMPLLESHLSKGGALAMLGSADEAEVDTDGAPPATPAPEGERAVTVDAPAADSPRPEIVA